MAEKECICDFVPFKNPLAQLHRNLDSPSMKSILNLLKSFKDLSQFGRLPRAISTAFAFGIFLYPSISQAQNDSAQLLAPYREAAQKKWTKAIDAFDDLNKKEIDPSDAIMFIGSSSIRRWETMAKDMAPYPTIRRGYGGAKFTDMGVFVKRIVTPHRYRALVMFIGNGVTGDPKDHTPDQIEALTRHIVSVSQGHQTKTPVFLIEITPCQKRFKAWPKIRAVNSRLREIALSTPHIYFIPTASNYLKPDGTPRSELFVEDQLHLSEAGYKLWAKLISRRLGDVLPSQIEENIDK